MGQTVHKHAVRPPPSPQPAGATGRRKPAPAPQPADATLVSKVGGATQRILIPLDASASQPLIAALIDKAQHGVSVRALINPSGGHDKTWLLQQRLESSGVDVDVQSASPPANLLLIADNSEIDAVPSGGTTPITGAVVDQHAAALMAQVDGPAVSRNPSPKLIAPEAIALLPMPESGNRRLIEIIDAARESIDLEIYQLQDPAVVAALIRAKSERNVTVRVMLEPKTVGAANFVPEAAALQAAKIEVKPTPPEFDSAHNVDHAKLMIVDGKELVFGTGNLVRSGLGGPTDSQYANRDFWVEDGRAASIGEAKQLFEADWARQPTTGMNFKNLLLTPDNADARLLALVGSATKRLYVYNQELNDAAMIAALIAAKKKNPSADVKVLLGYQPSFGGAPPPNDAALKQLVAAGIGVAYLKKHYLHAKGIVADDRAYLGSQNFTAGGLKNNRELGQVFDDATLVKSVASIFGADFASPG